MKTITLQMLSIILGLAFLTQVSKAAEVQGLPSASLSYHVAERGADFRVMQSVRQLRDSTGQMVIKTNRYTVLGNGMNRQDATGNWVECQPVLQSFPSGVVCTGATYQVILKQNLNRQGSVDVETGDKSRFISHPLAIAYFDPDTGRREWVAQIKDCQAEVVSNKVIYANAFAGRGIEAAVVYTYDRGRFQQDVIFTKKPGVTPADLGMGSGARVEIVTEIMQSPTPTKQSRVLKGETNALVRSQMVEPDLVDESLVFSEQMRMPLGFAFPNNLPGSSKQKKVSVAKRLRTMVDGRTVLTEAVEWRDVRAELDKLPRLTASIAKPATGKMFAQAMPARPMAERDSGTFERRLTKIIKSGPPLIASLTRKEPEGFVVDYQILEQAYSLSGGTYLVENGEAYVTGTFGGDLVIKFRPGASLRLTTSYPSVNWMLTAADDDSAGEIIADSTGAPSGYYGAYFQVDGIMWENFGNVECRYMNVGMDVTYNNYFSGVDWTFRHCDVGLRLSADNVYLSVQSFSACDVETPIDPGNNSFSPSIGGVDCDGDLDDDGLNDGWEMRYFGGLGGTGAGDYDGDGVSNLTEFLQGRNPTVAGAAADTNGLVRLKTFTPLK